MIEILPSPLVFSVMFFLQNLRVFGPDIEKKKDSDFRLWDKSKTRSVSFVDTCRYGARFDPPGSGGMIEVGLCFISVREKAISDRDMFSSTKFITQEKVKRLLDEGMDVNVAAWGPKCKGITPLHLAAEGGHLVVMDELLERGANIDARTKGACGWTPLHNAAKERRREAVKFLVENGAFLPPDINDCRFNPPLHYCPGLEWAYEELERLQQENSSSGETSYSSES
ncbi:hypothetical protein L484_022726 [Morus notabilis]|uniref:Uncharacterized protein n=1 Tax=Morus notabilis TaxID=981085 RepID=W9SML1_9ROSA|nr:hypothetical protein L484_022726 [Morus notabilis]